MAQQSFLRRAGRALTCVSAAVELHLSEMAEPAGRRPQRTSTTLVERVGAFRRRRVCRRVFVGAFMAWRARARRGVPKVPKLTIAVGQKRLVARTPQ